MSELLIVGLGASAGGLAAFEAFFSALAQPGPDVQPARAVPIPAMAYVLVQHQDPHHPSQLPDLLRAFVPATLSIRLITDGMAVQADHVYVLPPDQELALLNGTFQVLPRTGPGNLARPIDYFFRSLAQEQRERAIGIVLSGAGGDGTLGLCKIKEQGGMAMVQTPASAAHEGMPCSAIASGVMDYELAPGDMPARLLAYAAHAFGKPPQPNAISSPETEACLAKVFVLLRDQTSHDFSHYKLSSILRRIQRRMVIHQLDRMDNYVTYCQRSPREIEFLYRELLIGVTRFFRDPQAFRALEATVLPALFANAGGPKLRLWSAGCSTGEEAYSLAMLLTEYRAATGSRREIQIFATDLDGRAIATARSGLYPTATAGQLSPERLARHFTRESASGGYRINPAIRDLIVFSEQDVLRDPPFSRLDLISCRNLLIYMDETLHKQLIPMFHYVLNPGGTLFLGTSETVGGLGDRFAALDREMKLYRRLDVPVNLRDMPLLHCLPTLAKAQPAALRAEARPPAVAAAGSGEPGAEEAFLRSANEELVATNRSMHAINEELHSTNEELETSKEELQSMNEAMGAIQEDLQTKVAALSRANNDMSNLLAGTSVGTVFIDPGMNILRFTPSAAQMINLIPGDVGRPLAHIVSNLIGYHRLVQDTRAVLERLDVMEKEVQTLDGHWFTLRIQPYRTLDDAVEGAVITFVDITEMKRIQEALRKANELHRLAVVVRDAHDAITVQDLEGWTLAWNPGAVRMYGWTESEALGMNVRDRIPAAVRDEALGKVLELSRAEVLEPYLTLRSVKGGAVVHVSITSTALVDGAGEMYAISTTERQREGRSGSEAVHA